MPEQIKRIEIGDLTEAVTSAVNRALQAQKSDEPVPSPWRYPRIIIGLIYEPHYPGPPVEEQPQ